MGIKAKWTTTCDGDCGTVATTELTPEDEGIGGYIDIFGPGWPDNWLQVTYDEVVKKAYLFFHSRECYKEWLRKQGREQEALEFDEGVWS